MEQSRGIMVNWRLVILGMHTRLISCIAACLVMLAWPVIAQEVARPLDSKTAETARLVDASKHENGLTIYSNIAQYNWRFMVESFQEKYPWISVTNMDPSSRTVFAQYNFEIQKGKPTADLLVAAMTEGWFSFAESGGMAPYVSLESEHLPAWSMPRTGLYTVSTDPMIIIFNKLMLGKESPSSIKEVTAIAASDPDKFRDKLTTYDARAHVFAYAIHEAFEKFKGKSGQMLMNQLGAFSQTEAGGAYMAEKVTNGEYAIGYFVSAVTVFPRLRQAGRGYFMGWNLIKDGTPVFARMIGITKGSKSPNSARLWLNFILSHEGQVAAGQGGLTPYRPDVINTEVPYLVYQDIVDQIGAENIITIGYKPEVFVKSEAFLKRWKKAYRLAD